MPVRHEPVDSEQAREAGRAGRMEVDPASLSLLELGDNFVYVRLLNAPSTGSPLELPAVRHQ